MTDTFPTGFEALRRDIQDVASYLWQRGWAEANGGNLSIRLREDQLPALQPHSKEWVPLPRRVEGLGGERFFVTGSGRRFRDLAKQLRPNACLVELSNDGTAFRLIWGGESADFRPTSELASHLALHESLAQAKRPQRLVLHTHPMDLIALSHLSAYKDEARFSRALISMMPEVKVLLPRGVGYVPYAIPGTVELAEATGNALARGFDVILWEMHGALAVAEEIQWAFDLLDTANKGAAIFLRGLATGETPQGMSDNQLVELGQAFGVED